MANTGQKVKEQRRSPRYRCGLVVDLTEGRARRRLISVDVSRHGLFLSTETPPRERFLVRLTVHLPDGPMSGTAFVSRSVGTDAGGLLGAGFQFFALSMQSKQRWDSFIHQIAGRGTVSLPVAHIGPPDRATFIIKLKDMARLLEFYEKNFTAGGLYIATPVLKETGAEVGLVIVHPDSEQEFMLVGRVERVCDEKPKGMEVCLQPLLPDERRQFRDFIKTGVSPERTTRPDGGSPTTSTSPVASDTNTTLGSERTREEIFAPITEDAARPRIVDIEDPEEFDGDDQDDHDDGDDHDGREHHDDGDEHDGGGVGEVGEVRADDAFSLEGVVDVAKFDVDEVEDDDDDDDDEGMGYDIHLAPLGQSAVEEDALDEEEEARLSGASASHLDSRSGDDGAPGKASDESQPPEEPTSADISIDIVEDEEAIRQSEKFGWDDVTGRGFVIDYALSEYESQRAQSIPGEPQPSLASADELESVRLHVRVSCQACGVEYGALSLGPPRPPMGLFTRRVPYFCPRERILVGVLRLNHARRRARLREQLDAATLGRNVTLRFAFDLVSLSGAPRCPSCGGNTRRTSLAKAVDDATSKLTREGYADLPKIRCTRCGEARLRASREEL
ncbi:MAG: PilZ domain-containing protein [Deltaproteobacteria bacterium]|nr:PilZ domain-containing protein [Deltaproteobacteria bacterium]